MRAKTWLCSNHITITVCVSIFPLLSIWNSCHYTDSQQSQHILQSACQWSFGLHHTAIMDRYVILWATYPGMHFHNNLMMLQYMKHAVTLKLIYSAHFHLHSLFLGSIRAALHDSQFRISLLYPPPSVLGLKQAVSVHTWCCVSEILNLWHHTDPRGETLW